MISSAPHLSGHREGLVDPFVGTPVKELPSLPMKRSGFMGVLDQRRPYWVVVGGGISGLLAAYFAKRAGYKTVLVEKELSLGGLIRTVKGNFGIAETAAHSFLLSNNLKRHFSDLGVDVVPLKRGARARYILKEGQPRRWPLSTLTTFRLAKRILFHRWPAFQERTLFSEWLLEFLGPRVGSEVSQYLADPALAGIYSSGVEELSVWACFPQLAAWSGRTFLEGKRWKKAANSSGLSSEPRAVHSACRGGMSAWIDALKSNLEGCIERRFVRCWDEVGALVSQRWGTHVNLSRDVQVVLCTGAADAAAFLRASHNVQQVSLNLCALGDVLARVPMKSIQTQTTFIDSQVVPERRKGVGCLIPRVEGGVVRGLLLNSSSFEDRAVHGVQSFTAIGAPDSRFAEEAAGRYGELQSCSQEKVRQGTLEISSHVWAKGLPIYGPELVGIWDEMRKILQENPGVAVFGNYTGQISLRGLVESAKGAFEAQS